MESTINMQDMRYLNLFEKVTKIHTRHCFKYNEVLFYAIPKKLISKAIGRNNENLKRISEILKKRIRVVSIPNSVDDIDKFVSSVIAPVEFKEINVSNGELILTAGQQNKAALIGRNKRRMDEMKKLIKSFFGLEYKIV